MLPKATFGKHRVKYPTRAPERCFRCGRKLTHMVYVVEGRAYGPVCINKLSTEEPL